MKSPTINRKVLTTPVLLLVGILLVASFLRLWRVRDYLPFLGDEGRDALVWLHMVRDHHFTFLGPTASVGGFYLGPIYYYLALPFYFVWNDPVGPALFVAFVGIATVWLVYYVGKQWFGEAAGLIGAWLYAITSLVVRYSRSSWNPNPLPFFSLLGMYLVSTGMKDRKGWKILGAGICLGIAWQLHYLALLLAPVYGAIMFVEIFDRRPHQTAFAARQSLTLFLFFILGWVIGFSPFLAFEIYHHFPNTKTVIEFVTRPEGKVLDWELLGLARSIVRHINRLYFTVFEWSDGAASIVTATISVIGGIIVVAQRKRWAFLVWFVLGIAIFSLYQGSIADYYFGFLFPAPFLLLGALGGKVWEKRGLRSLVLFLVLILTIDQSQRWVFAKTPNRLLGQTESVASAASAFASGTPYNFALIADGNSDHAYRYFLERMGVIPVPLEQKVTDQLIVVCEKPKPDCAPLGNPLWEIAGFGRAEVVGEQSVPPGITVYRMIHHVDSIEFIGKPAKKG